MKKILCSIGALLLGAPLLASAADGWVVADISLQAGPDTDFPSLAMLEAGTPVAIQGCIDGWTWCDVVADEDRGWVPGTFLEEQIGGRPLVIIDAGARIGIPIVSFSIGTYWDRHYHNRPFYSQRSRFESFRISAHHSAPPRPTRIVAAAPRPGTKPRPMAATSQQRNATVSGTATTRGQRSTQTRLPPTSTATTPQREASTTRETAQRDTMQREQARRESAQRDSTQQRDRERDASTATAQSSRTEQPMRDDQRQNEQRRAAQTQPRQTPPDVAPRPEERPQAQPQERPARQIAREEHGNPPQRDRGAKQDQPKPKDELKQPKKNKDNKDKDDNGGGR